MKKDLQKALFTSEYAKDREKLLRNGLKIPGKRPERAVLGDKIQGEG